MEDDDGASSDEERMKRDGAIEEDGKYDGSAVDNLQLGIYDNYPAVAMFLVLYTSPLA